MSMELSFSRAEFEAILPSTILFATGLVLLVVDLFVRGDDPDEDRRSAKSHLIFIGCAGAVLALVSLGLGGSSKARSPRTPPGLYPKLILDVIQPSIDQLLAH